MWPNCPSCGFSLLLALSATVQGETIPNLARETIVGEVLLTGAPVAPERKRQGNQMLRATKLCLHRGASQVAPENTIPAVEETIRLGADFVELDIRTTRDGVPVVMHDSTVDRTTDGTGRIAAMDLVAVRKLDAGIKFAPAFRGVRVPTFEECLEITAGKIDLYIDAKEVAPEALLEMMRKYNLLEGSVVYQSPAYLARLKDMEPKVKTLAPLVATAAIDAMARGLKPYGVDVPWRLLSQDLVDRCHRHGIQVFSDAPDGLSVQEYVQAMRLGVDVIQTDEPLTLLRAYETLGESNE